MKLKTQITQVAEIDIPVPSFYINKDETKAVALLDEETVSVASGGSYMSYIAKGTPDCMQTDLRIANESMTPCTGKEWFKIYYAILQSISLNPVLK